MSIITRSSKAISRAVTAAIIAVILVIAIGSAATVYLTQPPASTATATVSVYVTTSVPATSPSGLKVFKIMIFSTNALATPWAQAVEVGLLAAISALNNTGGYTILLTQVWGQSVSNFEAIMTTYAQQGYNLIIDQAIEGGAALDTVAPKFPNTQFLGHVSDTGPNWGTTEEDYWKCDYMRGVVAGLATKKNVIGYVAAFQFPLTTMAINAYLAGAQIVNPKVKLAYTYSNSWTDPVAGASAGKALASLGADVIAGYGDAMVDGMVSGAQASGVYAEGYLHDTTSMAPKTVLTNVMWNSTAYFYKAIQAAQVGQVGFKTYSLNIYPDHACWVTPVQNLSPDATATANKYIQMISEGQLVPPANDTLPAKFSG